MAGKSKTLNIYLSQGCANSAGSEGGIGEGKITDGNGDRFSRLLLGPGR